jgi:predicted GNAT family N-acyltransferase
MLGQEIPLEQLRVVKLSSKNIADLQVFDTDVKELKDFLVEDAINNYNISISTTYLWYYNPENKLVAYITLLTDAIRVHGTQLGKSFVDKGVEYKTLPALKIGRMCVDKNYTGRDVGTHMMHFTMKLILETNEKVGCRFIVLDAKTQTNATRFYKKFDFEILKKREKGTTPMFLDMIKYINYYREGKKKLKPSHIMEASR